MRYLLEYFGVGIFIACLEIYLKKRLTLGDLIDYPCYGLIWPIVLSLKLVLYLDKHSDKTIWNRGDK